MLDRGIIEMLNCVHGLRALLTAAVVGRCLHGRRFCLVAYDEGFGDSSVR